MKNSKTAFTCWVSVNRANVPQRLKAVDLSSTKFHTVAFCIPLLQVRRTNTKLWTSLNAKLDSWPLFYDKFSGVKLSPVCFGVRISSKWRKYPILGQGIMISSNCCRFVRFETDVTRTDREIHCPLSASSELLGIRTCSASSCDSCRIYPPHQTRSL